MSASTTASTGSEATPSGAPAQRPAGGGAGRGPRAGRCNQPWRGWGGPPRESEAGGSIRSESPCPLLGGGITDDTLLHIARFLTAAEDLLRLELTCPRFAAKVIKTPSVTGGGDGPAAAAEMLSIPAEAARLWVAGCSEQERGWVPRRQLESWLSLMHELGALRLPLAFGRAHGSITLSEDGALATREGFHISMDNYRDTGYYRSAASNVVMRSGRHFAQLTMVAGGSTKIGVQRPGWDVEGGSDPHTEDGTCFYDSATGGCYSSGWYENWAGRQRATATGDRIGMLLDLDQGSMSVWKNGERLGVMQKRGLTGPLCWAVVVSDRDVRIEIESAAVPVTTSKD